VASTTEGARVSGMRLARVLVTSPTWLIGEAALIAAFLFQALALHTGALSVVQPILVLELVFALILRRIWHHEDIPGAAWASAVAICAGLGVFVGMAEPRGGDATPTSSHWFAAVVLLGALVGLLVLIARWGSPTLRAALYGSAAAVVWALEATFIKAATDTISQFGFWGAFLHWPLYAVAVGGVVGTLLVQAALHVGPLTVSQPFMVIIDPIISIMLGIWLYQERFTRDGTEIAIAGFSFALVVGGVLVMTTRGAAGDRVAVGDSRPTRGGVGSA
jgi:hypothetical protein